jgi:hypothetical protein
MRAKAKKTPRQKYMVLRKKFQAKRPRLFKRLQAAGKHLRQIFMKHRAHVREIHRLRREVNVLKRDMARMKAALHRIMRARGKNIRRPMRPQPPRHRRAVPRRGHERKKPRPRVRPWRLQAAIV